MNKAYKIIIAIIILLTILIPIIYLKFLNKNDKFVESIDRHLSGVDKKFYQDKLMQAETELVNAKTNEEKYNAYIYKGEQEYGLGLLKNSQLDYEEAERYNDKNNPSVYSLLYSVKFERGDFNGSLESIKKAVELNPTNPQYWRYYIMLEQDKLNATKEVLNDLYQKALLETKNNIDIVTVYAQYLESVQNFEGAKFYWQKAILLYPSNKNLYSEEINRIDKLIKQ